jgi:hypothetical protein
MALLGLVSVSRSQTLTLSLSSSLPSSLDSSGTDANEMRRLPLLRT